ncbi:MAG: TetR/AcrR family transcriptional regulator [Sciscionella sp.]|nr:TetR/AcrR family transcriptional regulator [Sciscionella sp.]
MVDEIKKTAREHLATDGANLSLRAVARDLGMVSSAVYRYFDSRDALLTALIIDAYNDLGDAVERAESPVPRKNLARRWTALATAVRDWAVANQPEYALLYGSPVPGYRAPQDTIEPASRPVLVFARIVADAVAAGATIEGTSARLPKAVRADLAKLRGQPGFGGIAEPVFAKLILVWAQLFGLISFELFGRLVGSVDDNDAFFAYFVRTVATEFGLS